MSGRGLVVAERPSAPLFSPSVTMPVRGTCSVTARVCASGKLMARDRSFPVRKVTRGEKLPKIPSATVVTARDRRRRQAPHMTPTGRSSWTTRPVRSCRCVALPPVHGSSTWRSMPAGPAATRTQEPPRRAARRRPWTGAMPAARGAATTGAPSPRHPAQASRAPGDRRRAAAVTAARVGRTADFVRPDHERGGAARRRRGTGPGRRARGRLEAAPPTHRLDRA